MSNASEWWADRIRELPCAVCGAHGVHAHHATGHDAGRGLGKKTGSCLLIPLCVECHSMMHHTGTKAFERQFGAQIDMVSDAIESVARRLMR